MSFLAAALLSLAFTIMVMPPKYDPAIIIKRRQIRHITRDQFHAEMRRAIPIVLLVWASVAVIAFVLVS